MRTYLIGAVVTLICCGVLSGTACADYEESESLFKNKKYKQAFDACWEEAQKGEAKCQVRIGYSYKFGRGVVQDYKQAMEWFQLAADQGDAGGQTNVALLYAQGQGVEKDSKKAAKWYRLAADQGYRWAQYNLGHAYQFGHGVTQDYVEAIKLFRRAADQNYKWAQYSLGRTYELGRGVAQDDKEALKWYQLAADQGHRGAKEKVESSKKVTSNIVDKTKIDMARDYVTIGKTNEARNLLNQVILADPLDADVHYEAGLVYLELKSIRDFNLAMENACKLKPSNCSKVADQQYVAGLIFISEHKNEVASFDSFQKSFKKNSNNRQRAITNLLAYGEANLLGGNYKLAERYFDVLLKIDPQSQSKVADIFYKRALNPSNPFQTTMWLFQEAVRHSSDYKKQAGYKLAEMAKDSKYSERDQYHALTISNSYLNKQ